jgi:hypothetical protein
MAKKRPTLDAFLTSQSKDGEDNISEAAIVVAEASHLSERLPAKVKNEKKASAPSKGAEKPEIVRHMLYLPLPVYDQLQELIFEEQRGQKKRRKTHDYLLDAIDLLFKKKGLKSISELVDK